MKNAPKNLPKRRQNPTSIEVKNMWVFNIDFFTSWPRFGSLLGFQVRRAACSAWRVRAYCIFAFGNPVRKCLGGGRVSDRGQTWACWGQLGTMLAHFSLLSASWAYFSRLAAFVAPFGRFFRDLGRCLLYTSPSPRDGLLSRMPSSA